jgi:hypothetical protein
VQETLRIVMRATQTRQPNASTTTVNAWPNAHPIMDKRTYTTTAPRQLSARLSRIRHSATQARRTKVAAEKVETALDPLRARTSLNGTKRRFATAPVFRSLSEQSRHSGSCTNLCLFHSVRSCVRRSIPKENYNDIPTPPSPDRPICYRIVSGHHYTGCRHIASAQHNTDRPRLRIHSTFQYLVHKTDQFSQQFHSCPKLPTMSSVLFSYLQ